MFNKEISGLTLTKQVADSLFQNICGARFRGDVSFLATLRALMHQRVPEGESISLLVNSSRYGVAEIVGSDPKDCVRAYLRNTLILAGECGVLNIHSFEGSEEANTACFTTLDNGGVEKLMGGFTSLPDVNKWLEQHGKVRARVFLNHERKCVLIFVERLDMKRWHLLQSLLPRYFPWYVEENPFNEEEVSLLRSLTRRYAPEYEERIEEFAKKFDFRTQAVRNALRGFETRFEQDRLVNVRNQIRSMNNNIENLHQQFANYYQQLADLTTQELGLIEKINRGGNDEDSEFLEYFLCNKSLNIVSVSGSEIEFIVTTVISSFDPDLFESTINKVGQSFFYRHYQTGHRYENREMTDERIRRLMIAIFQDEIMKLRVCAAYRLDFGHGNYRGLKNYTYPADILRDHTPNQHIQYYACLGNNEPHIRKAMLSRDYVAAVSNCCASATNINLTEANTGTFFMEKICANNVGRIIQMPDGTTATPLDAVKWLEEQDATQKKEEEEKTNG